MSVTPIFSEDFYTQSLFQHGERACITDAGSIVIAPEESTLSRLTRFFTFQQDPHIDKVHDRLKTIMEEIENNSSSTLSSDKEEVHAPGDTKVRFLQAILHGIRQKLDHVGPLNPFSPLVLKRHNVFVYTMPQHLKKDKT